MGIDARQTTAKCSVIMNKMLLLLVLVLGVAGCSKLNSSKENEATLPEVNRALARWTMERGTYPNDIGDLTNSPALRGKRLPQVPTGQKLVLDAASHLIVITNE